MSIVDEGTVNAVHGGAAVHAQDREVQGASSKSWSSIGLMPIGSAVLHSRRDRSHGGYGEIMCVHYWKCSFTRKESVLLGTGTLLYLKFE